MSGSMHQLVISLLLQIILKIGKKWWLNPSEVQLYQFMGKDNIPFHTVIFPSSLLGTGDRYTMLHHINTTEYLNYEYGKFSKSRGSGVFGDNAMETNIPSEIWRYYLLSNRPETSDSSFLWEDFASKSNSELLANLGNLVNRALSFVKAYFDYTIPPASLEDDDKQLILDVNQQVLAYIDLMENVKLKDGLHKMMRISAIGNKYMQDTKPWVDAKKGEKKIAGTRICILSNLVYILAILAEPFIPTISEEICTQLKKPLKEFPLKQWDESEFLRFLPTGHRIGEPQPLFRKIDEEEIDELRERFRGQSEEKSGKKKTVSISLP